MAENKVQFNLKNVHYSIVTETVTSGVTTYTYATPVAVTGAVTLTLDPVGEVSNFYADGLAYYSAVSNGGYSGELEMARFPDKMMKEVWGMTEGTTSKVLSENASTQPNTFALLYQIDGDSGGQYYCLYKCTGTRPGIGSTTTSDTTEPQTQSSSITAVPRADGLVFARTTDGTPAATKSSWFTTVFQEGSTNAGGGTVNDG